MLNQPHAFALEAGSKQKRRWGQASCCSQRVAEFALRWQHVLSWSHDLAFNSDARVLTLHREPRLNGTESSHNITVDKGGAFLFWQLQLHHALAIANVQSLECDSGAVCQRRETASHANQISQRFSCLEFVYGLFVDAAMQRNLGARRQHMDDVVGLHQAVSATVSTQQKIVEVQGTGEFVVPAQFNAAKASCGCGATSAHDGVHDRREACHRIGSGTLHKAGYINSNPS